MHDYCFEQLINVGQVRQLLESHHLLSGMAYGLFDSNENDIASAGWQEICIRFHRVHPVCAERCRESNASIKAHLGEVRSNYLEYRCRNGMIDIAMPIIIEGQHLATFFIGQFFYEDERPDRAFFLAQAKEFGFDPDDYLAALEQVPILNREHARSNLMFLHSMVLLLAESGLKSLKLGREMELRNEMANELRKLNGELEQRVEERTAKLTQANRMLSILIACRRAIMRAENEQTLLDDICHIMCDEAGYRFCWVGYAEHDEKRSIRPIAWAGVEDGYLALLNITWADTVLGRGPSGSAIRLGEIKHVQNIASDPDFSPWCASAMERGYRSSIALPLRDATETLLGAFNIYSSEAYAFTRDEILLLADLAEDLAFAISVLRMRSERQWLENSLIIKEREYRTLFENLPDLIVRYDTGLRRIYVNPAWENTCGLSAGEVINVHADDITSVHRPIDSEYSDKLRKVIKTGTSQSIGFTWVNARGVKLYLDYTIVPEFDLQGNVISMLAVGHDITERKQMETTLRKSEKRYRTNCNLLQSILESSPDVIVFALDTNCKYLTFNTRHKEVIKTIWGVEIAIGMNMLEVIGDAADRERARLNFMRALSGESFILEEWYGSEQLVRECWLDYYAPIRSDDGDITGLTCFVQNISERKRIERALVANEQQFRSLMENSPDIVIRYDTECRRIFVNPAFIRLVGEPSEALLGAKPTDRFPSIETINYGKALEHALKSGKEVKHEYAWSAVDGQAIISHLRIVPEFGADRKVTSILAIGRDITEFKRLEEQLHQSQKMEAVGQLAGGIAHDFNNIMTAIVGFAQIIGMKLGHDSPLNSFIDRILDSAERAAGLTRDLLTFSRKDVMLLKPIDIGEAITGAQQLILRLLREDIKLTLSLPDAQLTVMAGETQLTQILMNLTANARDAMPSGGKINITFSPFSIDREYVERHGYGREGKFALIIFADTGYGMDKKICERIFEPFFTTKVVGQGTGLGLSTVYGIIRQLGGFIKVYSEPGKGTIFRIYLPLIGSTATGKKTISHDTPLPGGTETVLLAEDDPDVREIEESILREAGYMVISARDGAEALRLFSDHKNSIDLLILDAIMPGNNGLGVFQQAQQIRPQIKAILVSGYTNEIMVVDGLIEQGLEFLHKPVTPSEFLRMVRQVLDCSEI